MDNLIFYRPLSLGLSSFFLLFLAFACTSNYQKSAVKPVVRVNDHILTVKDFADTLARRLKNHDVLSAKDTGNIARIKESILTEFVESALIEDWAKANGISISSDELEKEVSRIRSNYPDDLSFRRFLAEEDLSFSDWKESLYKNMVVKSAFAKINTKTIQPNDEEIQSYFKANTERFKKKEKISFSQIVLADEAAAEQVQKSIKGGDFSSLAKRYSITPEGKNGGNVGWIEKGTVDFFDPLFTMPLGIVNKIIQSPFGFHLIKIEKKTPAGLRGVDDVKAQIVRALLAKREQAEFMKWLDVQLRSTKVFKDHDLINSISISTRGKNE